MAHIPVLLLLALPASGKSEIRRYLEHPDPTLPALPLGPTIQLDDYPYVHLMRVISSAQQRLGLKPAFFEANDSPFADPRDWITLIHLINENFAAIGMATAPDPDPSALLDRLDAARRMAGIDHPSAQEERNGVAAAIAAEAAWLAATLPLVTTDELAESTVIVEFARGGPEGAAAPLPDPLGYRHSLAALSPPILERAAILYVWVTPEESRRRNRERVIPGAEGDASTLHHGVPETVMRHDYGMDDIDWLERTAKAPASVTVVTAAGKFDVPVARFDNRVDRTSFLRDDPGTWPPEQIGALHRHLAESLHRLDRARTGDD